MSVADFLCVDTPSGLGGSVLHTVLNYGAKLDEPLPPTPKAPKRLFHNWRRKREAEELKRRRLEEVLAFGNWLYDAVRRVERNWRSHVMQGTTLYDPAEETLILGYYRQWTRSCDRCEAEIAHFDSDQQEVRGAVDFRARCIEARKLIEGENPFFADMRNKRRWDAATEFLRPSPRPVMTDREGRIFERTGERLSMPGLEPADILEALEDERAGRVHSFEEVASLDEDEESA
jgi:hypothetical protein